MIRGQIAADYVTGSDPEKINTMQGIRKNLCSLAYPAVGQLKPEMCSKCISKCGYGKRLLRILAEEEGQLPKKRGRPKGSKTRQTAKGAGK